VLWCNDVIIMLINWFLGRAQKALVRMERVFRGAIWCEDNVEGLSVYLLPLKQ
jgi:hypothetical protein